MPRKKRGETPTLHPEGGSLVPEGESRISSIFLDSGAFGLYNFFASHAAAPTVARFDADICEALEQKGPMTSRELYDFFSVEKQDQFRTHLHRMSTLGILKVEHKQTYSWSVVKMWRERLQTDVTKKNKPYWKTGAFKKYVDQYALWVSENVRDIDHYATVDVLYQPEASYKVQKYLEQEWGLNPVPIIHYGTDIKWFHRYLEEGYKLIGLGGIGKGTSKKAYCVWADALFEAACPPPSKMPLVKIHGFAMTSHSLLKRYPWWSVDSASWSKWAAYGIIYVGRKYTDGKGERTQKYDPLRGPSPIFVSRESDRKRIVGKHVESLVATQERNVFDWLEFIGIPYGDEKTWGVSSANSARVAANLRFLDFVAKALPKWPWPFNPGAEVSLGYSEDDVYWEGKPL